VKSTSVSSPVSSQLKSRIPEASGRFPEVFPEGTDKSPLSIWALSEPPYTGLETLKEIILFGYVFAYPMAIFVSFIWLQTSSKKAGGGKCTESARGEGGGCFEYVALLVHCTRHKSFL